MLKVVRARDRAGEGDGHHGRPTMNIDGIPCNGQSVAVCSPCCGRKWDSRDSSSPISARSRALEKTHHVRWRRRRRGSCLADQFRGRHAVLRLHPRTFSRMRSSMGIKDGKLKPEALDRAVTCVLRAKFMLGLFDHPFTDPALDAKVSRAQAHLDVSLRSPSNRCACSK